ncbi:hypothetical protein CALCODRAFT_507570 [Calocera cornea HHB12733]|uniref:Uncharacterized protein n=1 Tax=Calocera cornea HHB12733 TaxID=1353952 RepID=A0A165HJ17_9BASI|nr:hypothetical protein CALCODRAFT_507570 [Calocera cornea HHB12733]
MCAALKIPTDDVGVERWSADIETMMGWLEDWSQIANPLIELFYYAELPEDLPTQLTAFLELIMRVAQRLEDKGAVINFEQGRYLQLQLIRILPVWRQKFPLLSRWKMETPANAFDIETDYGFLELFRRVGREKSILSVTWDMRIRILHAHIWQSMLTLHGPPPRLDVSTKEEAAEFVHSTGQLLALINQSAIWLNVGTVGGLLKAMILQHALYCRDTVWMHGIKIEDTIVTFGVIPEEMRHYVLGRTPFLWGKLLESNPLLNTRRAWFGEDPLRKDFLRAAIATQYASELTGTVHLAGEWANGDPRSIRWYLESASYFHDCYVNQVGQPPEIVELFNQFLADIDELLNLMPDVMLIPIPAEYVRGTRIPEVLLARRFRPLEGITRRPAKEDIHCEKPLLILEHWIQKFRSQRNWLAAQPEDPAAVRTAATTVAIFFATYNESALQSSSDELRQAVIELLDLLEKSINSTNTALWKYMPDRSNIPPGWRGAAISVGDVKTYVEQEARMLNDVFQHRPEAIYGVRYGVSLSSMFENMKLQQKGSTTTIASATETSDSTDQSFAMQVDNPHRTTTLHPTEDHSAEVISMLEEEPHDEESELSNSQTKVITVETLKTRGPTRKKRAQRRRKTQPAAVFPTGKPSRWSVMDDPRRGHYTFYSSGIFGNFTLLSLDRVHSDAILPIWHEGAAEWGYHDIDPKPILVGFLWITLKNAKHASKHRRVHCQLVCGFNFAGGVGDTHAGRAISAASLATIARCTSEMVCQTNAVNPDTDEGQSAVPADKFCRPEEFVRKKDLPDKDNMYEEIAPQLGLEGRPPLSQAEQKTLASKEAEEP